MPNSQLHVAINIDNSRAISSAQQVASAVTANLNTAQQVIDTVGNRQASALQGMQQKSFSFMTEALQKLGSTGAQTYRQYFGIFDDFSDKQKNALSQQSEINDSLDDHFKKLENQTNAQKRYSSQQQKNEQQWLEILTTDKKTDIDGQIKMTQEVITQLRKQSVSPSLASAIRKEISAGVDPTTIRVTKDGRLINPQNPNGFAVINTRDEPNGRIPNFAGGLPMPGGGGGGGGGLTDWVSEKGKLLLRMAMQPLFKLFDVVNLAEGGLERLGNLLDEAIDAQDEFRFSMYRATGSINDQYAAVLALHNQNYMGLKYNKEIMKSLLDNGIQYRNNRNDLLDLAKTQADFRIATNLSSDEIALMSKALIGMGATQKDVNIFFERSLQTVRNYGISMKSLSEVMKEVQTNAFKIINTFGGGAVSLERYHDVLLKIKGEYASQEDIAEYTVKGLESLIKKASDFGMTNLYSLMALSKGSSTNIKDIQKDTLLSMVQMAGGAKNVYAQFRELTEAEAQKLGREGLLARQLKQQIFAATVGVSAEELSALATAAQKRHGGSIEAAIADLGKPPEVKEKKTLEEMRDESTKSVKTQLDIQTNQLFNSLLIAASGLMSAANGVQKLVDEALFFIKPGLEFMEAGINKLFGSPFKFQRNFTTPTDAEKGSRELTLNPPPKGSPKMSPVAKSYDAILDFKPKWLEDLTKRIEGSSKLGALGEVGQTGIPGVPGLPWQLPPELTQMSFRRGEEYKIFNEAQLKINESQLKIMELLIPKIKRDEEKSSEPITVAPLELGREFSEPLVLAMARKKEEVDKASQVQNDEAAFQRNKLNEVLLAFAKAMQEKEVKPEENKAFNEMKELLAIIAGNTGQRSSQISLRDHFYGRGGLG